MSQTVTHLRVPHVSGADIRKSLNDVYISGTAQRVLSDLSDDAYSAVAEQLNSEIECLALQRDLWREIDDEVYRCHVKDIGPWVNRVCGVVRGHTDSVWGDTHVREVSECLVEAGLRAADHGRASPGSVIAFLEA